MVVLHAAHVAAAASSHNASTQQTVRRSSKPGLAAKTKGSVVVRGSMLACMREGGGGVEWHDWGV